MESIIGEMRAATSSGRPPPQSVSSVEERELTENECGIGSDGSGIRGGDSRHNRRHEVEVNASGIQELAWNDDEGTDGMGALTFAAEANGGFFGIRI